MPELLFKLNTDNKQIPSHYINMISKPIHAPLVMMPFSNRWNKQLVVVDGALWGGLSTYPVSPHLHKNNMKAEMSTEEMCEWHYVTMATHLTLPSLSAEPAYSLHMLEINFSIKNLPYHDPSSTLPFTQKNSWSLACLVSGSSSLWTQMKRFSTSTTMERRRSRSSSVADSRWLTCLPVKEGKRRGRGWKEGEMSCQLCTVIIHPLIFISFLVYKGVWRVCGLGISNEQAV